MSIKSFEDLAAWQSCRDLRLWFQSEVKDWPKEEKYDLVDQTRRAARSACANLAEGYGRNNAKDNARFCKISLGSLYETLNHLIDANECGYIDDVKLSEVKQLIEKSIKITRGYMRYLNGSDTLHEPDVDYGK